MQAENRESAEIPALAFLCHNIGGDQLSFEGRQRVARMRPMTGYKPE
jgi:hypothetical protein